MFDAARDQGGERHHPREGAAGHEEEEAGEPAERVHHQRRLLPRLRARAQEPAGPTRCTSGPTSFQRDLDDGADPGVNASGRQQARRCWCSAAGRSSAGLARDRRAHIEALRSRHQGDRARRCRRSIAYVHGVRDVEKPATMQGRRPRQSRTSSATRCRGASSSVLSDGDPRAIREGQRPARARRGDRRAADRHARDRQSRLEVALRHRHRGHAEQLREARRAPDAIPSCSSTWPSRFVDNGMSIKKLHRQIMLSAVYQLGAERRCRPTSTKDSGNRLYWRANRAAHDRRTDPRFRAVRLRHSRHEDGRTVRDR